MNSATTQRWFTFDKKRKPLLMFETKCQGKWDISTCQYSRQFANAAASSNGGTKVNQIDINSDY